MVSHLSAEELEGRMRPGRFSQQGFLGVRESLSEVIQRDAATLQRLNVGYAELAARLDELLRASGASDTAWPPERAPVTFPPHFQVHLRVYAGWQMCPWSAGPRTQCEAGGGVAYSSLDWHILNTRTGQAMTGPGLIVHLIREHHFFEGREAPYRVDPQELARLLELGTRPGGKRYERVVNLLKRLRNWRPSRAG
jgi:hypothetical protein